MNIKGFKSDISLPIAKMNYLLFCYITCNASQTFLMDRPVSFKKRLGLDGNDPDVLIDNIVEDIRALMTPYFDVVEVNVRIETKDANSVVYMNVTCDGNSVAETINTNNLNKLVNGFVVEKYYSVP